MFELMSFSSFTPFVLYKLMIPFTCSNVPMSDMLEMLFRCKDEFCESILNTSLSGLIVDCISSNFPFSDIEYMYLMSLFISMVSIRFSYLYKYVSPPNSYNFPF